VTSGAASPISATVIHYTYDPLSRLTGATYSGAYTYTFAYAYDEVGNCTVQTRTVTSTVVTTYTYDVANRLVTAKTSGDPNVWHYTSDANGNLVEVTPNGTTPTAGALRYTYDQANRLTLVEKHDGTAYQSQASMVYNSGGQRLRITAWQGGLSITSTYVVDSQASGAVLAATTDGQTTYYVHGYGVVAEHTSSWAYYLKDGQATVRQLTDAAGAVTLLRTYDPFGQVLTQQGSGNLTWGYFGGLLDAATGLIYFGNGLYYDPFTGRFLTPGGGGQNPYVPSGRSDPLGAMLGTTALLALFARRRRRNNKSDGWWLALIVLIGMSAGLVACEPGPGPGPTPPPYEIPPYQPPHSVRGLSRFVKCFELHTLNPFFGIQGDQTTAQQAVDICKAAYTGETWNGSLPGFNLGQELPTRAHDLFGWFVYDWRGRFNSDRLYFDANQPLTGEVARTGQITHVRQLYYNGDPIVGGPELYQFDAPNQISALFETLETAGEGSLSIPMFMGSFYYQVKTLDNDRVGFRIDNDTTLSSGTHVPGRWEKEGYTDSVERLIERDSSLKTRPLYELINDPENYKLISILDNRTRGETGGRGGGNLYQTFYWTEKRACTWEEVWFGEPWADMQVWEWGNLKSKTVDPPGWPAQ